MRHYELVVVLSPMLNQEQASDSWGRIKEFIGNREGEIFHEETWGTRRLAYPIRKGSHQFLEGSYHLTRFSAEKSFNRELHTFLRLDDEVLRSLVVVTFAPGTEPPPPPVRRRPTEIQTPVAEAQVAVVAEEPVAEAEKAAEAEVEKPVAEAEEAAEAAAEEPKAEAEKAAEEEAEVEAEEPVAEAEEAVEEEAEVEAEEPVAEAKEAAEAEVEEPVAEAEDAAEAEVEEPVAEAEKRPKLR